MNVPLVENQNGCRHLRPAGVSLLFAACLTSCLAIPAAGLWLAFHDPKLLGLTVTLGFGQAVFLFVFIVRRNLALPLEALPKAVGVLDDNV